MQELIHALLDFIAAPGWVLLALPGVEPMLAKSGGDPLVIASLGAWLLVAALSLLALRPLRNLCRLMSARLEMVAFRAKLFRTRITQAVTSIARKILPARSPAGIDARTVELSNIDIAVLRIATMQPPGHTISAPELVERVRMRPSIVQESLRRLRMHQLLETTIGDTDGFDNYRLTPIGAMFSQSIRENGYDRIAPT